MADSNGQLDFCLAPCFLFSLHAHHRFLYYRFLSSRTHPFHHLTRYYPLSLLSALSIAFLTPANDLFAGIVATSITHKLANPAVSVCVSAQFDGLSADFAVQKMGVALTF